jgi:hypothetical protein
MLSIFRPIIERLKALFAVAAAQELESECLARDAERRAELLRLASRYEHEGLHLVAAGLRDRAGSLHADRPLAGILPAADHLLAMPTPLALESSAQPGNASPVPALPAPKNRSKK